jgi:biopolymer transport protein ExbD
MTMTASTREPNEPMSAMNTTPLIDVMLVLLIMFIITIPIQTHAVRIDLPTGEGTPQVDLVKNRITIDAAGTIRWNGRAMDRITLRRHLQAALALPAEPEIQFEPDADARYVTVDEVLSDIKGSGITKLGFIGNERYQEF